MNSVPAISSNSRYIDLGHYTAKRKLFVNGRTGSRRSALPALTVSPAGQRQGIIYPKSTFVCFRGGIMHNTRDPKSIE